MTNLPSKRKTIRLLYKVGCSQDVIEHCKAVSELAVIIAKTCQEHGLIIDIDLVEVGALLHDVGRSKTHTVNHIIAGAEIARSLNLPETIIQIIERHIGAGITAEEAAELGLPRKDYLPQSLEEKIVAYADKLIESSHRVSIEDTINKTSKKLGPDHPAIARLKRLHEEFSSIVGDLTECPC